jgi:hypothetical protein
MAMARAASRNGFDFSRAKDIVSGGDIAATGVSFVGLNLGNAIQGLGAVTPEEDRKFFHKHSTMMITGGMAATGFGGYCYGIAPEFTATLFLTSAILFLNESSKKFWDSSSLLKPGARTMLLSKSQLQAMKAVQSGQMVPAGQIGARTPQMLNARSQLNAGQKSNGSRAAAVSVMDI